MNFEEVKKEISSLLSLSLSGQEIENPKVDCKRQWYNFNSEEDKSKFLKDSSSIANTVGLDGFIIIGYDEKNKTFFDAAFSDCGLRDTSDLNGIINKNVNRFYDISNHDIVYDGHKLSILHIPPSFDKPHVLTCYKNFKNGIPKEEKHRIFVRKGTSSDYATKYDLEFMYYDRKNVIPEYDISTSMNLDKMELYPNIYQNEIYGVRLQVKFTFENIGRRPIAIVLIDFQCSFDPPDEEINIEFTTGMLDPIIIHPNEMIDKEMKLDAKNFPVESFSFDMRDKFNSKRRHLQTQYLTLRASNNKVIKSELIRYI